MLTLINTDYLTKIEVALNLPSGYEDISPAIRLEAILQGIHILAHKANHENMEMRVLLNSLQDYLEVMTLDFSKFEDDQQEYEDGWEVWKIAYANRPQKSRIK